LGRLLDPEHQGQNDYMGNPDPWKNESYDVEDLAVGMIKMKNGAVINLRASWAVNMAEDAGANGQATVNLCGTKGGLDTIDGVGGRNLGAAKQTAITMVAKQSRPVGPGRSAGKPPRSKQAATRAAALEGTRELFLTADHAYVVTRVLDAIYES